MPPPCSCLELVGCFFLAPARQFLRALEVCSSKMDCFMVEPIWETSAYSGSVT